MELKEKDFDAKASQIQIEISAVLTEIMTKRGNKHIPEEEVNRVFHMAIKHSLAWAYNEGVEVHTSKITKGSEDKEP